MFSFQRYAVERPLPLIYFKMKKIVKYTHSYKSGIAIQSSAASCSCSTICYRNAKIIRWQKVQRIIVSLWDEESAYYASRVSVFKISDECAWVSEQICQNEVEQKLTMMWNLFNVFDWYLRARVCVCSAHAQSHSCIVSLVFLPICMQSLLLYKVLSIFYLFSVCSAHYKWSLRALHVVYSLFQTPYWACK